MNNAPSSCNNTSNGAAADNQIISSDNHTTNILEVDLTDDVSMPPSKDSDVEIIDIADSVGHEDASSMSTPVLDEIPLPFSPPPPPPPVQNSSTVKKETAEPSLKSLQKEPTIIKSADSGISNAVPASSSSFGSIKGFPVESDPLLRSFRNYLCNNEDIELPSFPTPENFTEQGIDYTAKKIAWWLLKSMKSPLDIRLEHPELHDEEIKDTESQNSSLSAGSETTEEGEYFSDEESKSMMSTSTTSTSKPDSECGGEDIRSIVEFCGASTMGTTVRKPGSSIEANEFMPVLEGNSATSYFKDSFQTLCFLCNEGITSHKMLAAHVRSSYHQSNFRNLSLNMGLKQYEEKVIGPRFADGVVSAKLKEYTLEEIGKLTCCIESAGTGSEDGDSKDVRVNITDYDIHEDQLQKDAKNRLRLAGKWNDGLQAKWNVMKTEEESIIKKYKEAQETYIQNPKSHPKHGQEWMAFWNRRCKELKAKGRNPDAHNFTPEWSRFWFKRLLDLLKSEADQKLIKLKEKSGLDTGRLQMMLNDKDWSESKSRQQQPKTSTAPTWSKNAPKITPKPLLATPKNKNNNNRSNNNYTRGSNLVGTSIYNSLQWTPRPAQNIPVVGSVQNFGYGYTNFNQFPPYNQMPIMQPARMNRHEPYPRMGLHPHPYPPNNFRADRQYNLKKKQMTEVTKIFSRNTKRQSQERYE